jgi:hypothetical protein
MSSAVPRPCIMEGAHNDIPVLKYLIPGKMYQQNSKLMCELTLIVLIVFF